MTSISEHIRKRATSLVGGTHTLIKLGIGLALVVLIAMMFPHGESIEYSYTVNTIWGNNDLVAPFSFPIFKDFRVYEKERQEAAKSVYPVFERNETAEKIQSENLLALWKQLRSAAEAHRRISKSSAKNDSLGFQQASVDLPMT